MGNTYLSIMIYHVATVHPHACGEHAMVPTTTGSPLGSSPRMWGTRSKSFIRQFISRFIPTHVGNTASATHPTRPAAVHPHACGEHSASHRDREIRAGSSPRMWGTRIRAVVECHCFWFIPTHVGNTAHRSRKARRWTVHPHACGEHSVINRDR